MLRPRRTSQIAVTVRNGYCRLDQKHVPRQRSRTKPASTGLHGFSGEAGLADEITKGKIIHKEKICDFALLCTSQCLAVLQLCTQTVLLYRSHTLSNLQLFKFRTVLARRHAVNYGPSLAFLYRGPLLPGHAIADKSTCTVLIGWGQCQNGVRINAVAYMQATSGQCGISGW